MLMRLLMLPLFCLALAVIEGVLYAAGPFGVFAKSGVVSGADLVRFLSPLAIDYLSLGLLLALLWWRHWSLTIFCCGLATLFGVLHFVQYEALEMSGEFAGNAIDAHAMAQIGRQRNLDQGIAEKVGEIHSNRGIGWKFHDAA